MKTTIIFRLFISAILLFSFVSCHKEDPRYEKTEEEVFKARVFEEDLYNSGTSHTFYVRKYPKGLYWTPFDIEKDWGLEVGYEYEVSAWKHWLKEPMYGNAVVFELREILSKKEVEPLTRDDIAVITL